MKNYADARNIGQVYDLTSKELNCLVNNVIKQYETMKKLNSVYLKSDKVFIGNVKKNITLDLYKNGVYSKIKEDYNDILKWFYKRLVLNEID
jgi:hypothetical protein